MYEDEQYECGKPRMGLVAQEGRDAGLGVHCTYEKMVARPMHTSPLSCHRRIMMM